MSKWLVLVILGVIASGSILSGCSKEPEVGYGGDLKTAPGGAPPPGGKGGGGMTVDPNK